MFALALVFAVLPHQFRGRLTCTGITTNVWTVGQQLLVKKLYPSPNPVTAQRGPALPRRGGNRRLRSRRVAAALTAGKGRATPEKGDAKEKTREKAKARGTGTAKTATTTGGNGARAKPPPSPRKKKKRSGRRR